MKKIFTLAVLLSSAIASNAQAVIYPAGSEENDNIITISIDAESEDVTAVPVTISLSNPTIGIAGIGGYFWFDDCTSKPWAYDEDEEDFVYDTSSRMTKQNDVFVSYTDAGDLTLSITNKKANALKGTDGELITLYFDATQLGVGNHTFHADRLISFVADGMTKYESENIDIAFDFDGTKLTLTGISNILSDAEATVAYDLSGRRVNGTANGLYICNGKKVVK